MKKVYYILGLALLIITICMIALVFKGVSLRSEPIIKPSAVDSEYKNINYGVVHRMFPNFQKSDYVVWGLNSDRASEDQIIFDLLQKEHGVQLGIRPRVLHWTKQTSVEEIKKCTKPCWITIDKYLANSLRPNLVVQSINDVLGSNYFSMTFLEFERNMTVSDFCEKEQRLDFECLLPVAVREVQKYLKKSDIRYFFTRAYNELDYFLFIEKKK
jgi:hypothetical protein